MKILELVKRLFRHKPELRVETREETIRRYEADNAWFDSLPEETRRYFENQYLVESTIRARAAEREANREFDAFLESRRQLKNPLS